MEEGIPVWRLLKKSRKEMMMHWSGVSRSRIKWSDLKYNLKVKQQSLLISCIQGLRKDKNEDDCRDFNPSEWKDGTAFIEMWKTRGGKSLGRKLRSLF